MPYPRILPALIVTGSFGLFLFWKGITDDITRTIDGKRLIPKWVLILGGLGVVMLPLFYLMFFF